MVVPFVYFEEGRVLEKVALAAGSRPTREPQSPDSQSVSYPTFDLAGGSGWGGSGEGAGLIPAQRCSSPLRRSASSRTAWRRTGTAAGPGG